MTPGVDGERQTGDEPAHPLEQHRAEDDEQPGGKRHRDRGRQPQRELAVPDRSRQLEQQQPTGLAGIVVRRSARPPSRASRARLAAEAASSTVRERCPSATTPSASEPSATATGASRQASSPDVPARSATAMPSVTDRGYLRAPATPARVVPRSRISCRQRRAPRGAARSGTAPRRARPHTRSRPR